MTFEELMTPAPSPAVGEECIAIRSFNWNGQRAADGLCIVCRNPMLSKRARRYCSNACAMWFTENHDWTTARHAALRHNIETNFVTLHKTSTIPAGRNYRTNEIIPAWTNEWDVNVACCSRCHRPESDYGSVSFLKSRLEVDHIIPINGGIRAKTCANHQDNLRVLCHSCHLEATKEQRAAGLIGKKL